MIGNLMAVGLGGGVGAAGRYLMGFLPCKSAFPFITLSVNVLGAVLIGFIAGLAETRGLQGRWLLFLKTGVCGGFTTFSTFSLEAFGLFQKNAFGSGVLYIVLSVLLCLGGIALGQFLAFRFFGN